MKYFDDVRAFHVKFGQPVDLVASPVCLLTPAAFEFRAKFLHEECEEFGEAHRGRDLVKAADAMVDLAYVAIGTMLYMGAKWGDTPVPYRPEQSTPHLLSEGVFFLRYLQLMDQVLWFTSAHPQFILAGERPNLLVILLKGLVFGCINNTLMMGIPFADVWDIVQRKNMQKERALPDGSNSTRGTSMDVVKPAGWTPPDDEIRELLIRLGANL